MLLLVGICSQALLLGPCTSSTGAVLAGTCSLLAEGDPHPRLSPPWSAEPWAQLGGAKVQPGRAALLSTPGPAAPLAARLRLFIPHSTATARHRRVWWKSQGSEITLGKK